MQLINKVYYYHYYYQCIQLTHGSDCELYLLALESHLHQLNDRRRRRSRVGARSPYPVVPGMGCRGRGEVQGVVGGVMLAEGQRRGGFRVAGAGGKVLRQGESSHLKAG